MLASVWHERPVRCVAVPRIRWRESLPGCSGSLHIRRFGLTLLYFALCRCPSTSSTSSLHISSRFELPIKQHEALATISHRPGIHSLLRSNSTTHPGAITTARTHTTRRCRRHSPRQHKPLERLLYRHDSIYNTHRRPDRRTNMQSLHIITSKVGRSYRRYFAGVETTALAIRGGMDH